MDREVDPPVQQRFIEFLGEQTLAADVRERTIENLVTGRLDHDDRNLARLAKLRMDSDQLSAGRFRLGQGKGASAGADAKRGHDLSSDRKPIVSLRSS